MDRGMPKPSWRWQPLPPVQLDPGEIQRVKSPRWTRAWSYPDQLLTRYLVLYFGWTRDFIAPSMFEEVQSCSAGRPQGVRGGIRAPTPCVAVSAARRYFESRAEQDSSSIESILFVCFDEESFAIYQRLLKGDT